MGVISMDDLEYLTQQSSGKINMILSGMTSLLNDTENKVAAVESQNWFQRMIKTVTGKNKATREEIRKNHDKLSAYMTEAIAELYNRNCIDQQVIMSLGIQMNTIYMEHIQLKKQLGAFVSKLDEKITSIDNFHMLETEIEQGVYNQLPKIIVVIRILSQLDKRTLLDERKMEIIHRSLSEQQILSDNGVELKQYLLDIADVSMDEVGAVYLESQSLHENFMADVFRGIIEKHHFLPDMERKMKSKAAAAEEIIIDRRLDSSLQLSTKEIFDEFIKAKTDTVTGMVQIEEIKDSERLETAIDLYLHLQFEDAYDIFKTLAEGGNARAMFYVGEYLRRGFRGVQEDVNAAKEWFYKGMEANDALAAVSYADLLEDGSSEKSEIYGKAFPNVLQETENGDFVAQNTLAEMYVLGRGIAVDVLKGIDWLEKSMEAGYWYAINRMGVYYIGGNGVEKNPEKAVEFYLQAANQGYASAQANLGGCYYWGEGVHKDENKAKEWLQKAMQQKHAVAIRMYNERFGKYEENLREIQKLCEDFERVYGGYLGIDFDVTSKLKMGLDIRDCDIYLGHDASLFKNGKVGFAITSKGFVSRASGHPMETVFTYKELAENPYGDLYWDGSKLYYEGNMVACCNTSDLNKDGLECLFWNIRNCVV